MPLRISKYHIFTFPTGTEMDHWLDVGLKIYYFLFFIGKGSSSIVFHFDSRGRTLLPTDCTENATLCYHCSLHPSHWDCFFFFFWCLFVFQNNFQYHLERIFHSELLSCRCSVSTAQLLLKTGRLSGDLSVIATEGTFHRYRADESYLAFVTLNVSKVLDILEIRLTMQILHHWHCFMA